MKGIYILILALLTAALGVTQFWGGYCTSADVSLIRARWRRVYYALAALALLAMAGYGAHYLLRPGDYESAWELGYAVLVMIPMLLLTALGVAWFLCRMQVWGRQTRQRMRVGKR